MRIIVTGGAGFIGSHIVDKYIELGHEVAVIDNFATGKKTNLNKNISELFELDIRDGKKVKKAIDSFKPVLLNHHAAQLDVRKSVNDPVYDCEVNIIGFINILEASRGNGLCKIIFSSSGGAVYGDTEKIPTLEDAETNPISQYGLAKLAGEHYLNIYHYLYNLRYVALRYSNVYGPRQNPDGEAGVVAIFAKKMLKNQTPIIHGDGLNERDFVYVGDVVEANVKALDYPLNLTVNIATGVPTTINDIFFKLKSLTRCSCKETHGKAKMGEQRRSVLDIKLAKETLEWVPQYTLIDGLRETVHYFRSELKA